MTRLQIQQINKERLDNWRETLDLNQATGTLLIGFGHNDQAGKVHMFWPGGLDPETELNVLAVCHTYLKSEILRAKLKAQNPKQS